MTGRAHEVDGALQKLQPLDRHLGMHSKHMHFHLEQNVRGKQLILLLHNFAVSRYI